MALYPQLSPPSPASYQPYPSPRTKSPSPRSTTQFKALQNLPTLKYPLTDITHFTLAQATVQLSSLAPTAARDEPPLSETREIPGNAPSRRGRGKNRRGRQRGVRPREVGGSISAGKVHRSPLPLAALSPRSSFHPSFGFRGARRKSTPALPILSIVSSQSLSHNTTNANPRTPRHRFPSAVTPETPRPAFKRTNHWNLNSPHRKISSPSPPSPTPATLRPSRSNKLLSYAPSCLHQLPPSPRLSFPIPPSLAPSYPRSSPHSNYGNHLSVLPSTNLGSGIAQGQIRKKRTKRDIAEVQWQITMHKSLAWRTAHEPLNAEKTNVCRHCTGSKEEPSHGAMDFAQGGLRIAFERPACTCASNNESQEGNRGSQLHWTEALDRELVKRLWVKLIAQGCRTMPVGTSNPPQASTPFPSVEDSQRGIPFPSEQPGQQLAPAIQLSASVRPSDPQMGSGIPLRQRVLAITSSRKTRPQASFPSLHISSPAPSSTATASMPPSSSLAVGALYPDTQCQPPRVSARTSRGVLSSAQLAAQAILRHEDARSNPMRRGRPPGIMQKGSSLRHEVTVEHAD